MKPEDTPFPEILLQFVKSFGDQVEGHARTALTKDQKQVLDQFADGDSSSDERQQVISLLGRNEEAIEYLASRLK